MSSSKHEKDDAGLAKAAALRARRLENAPNCTLCGLSGWVIAHKADDPIYEYAFICSCNAADIRGIRQDFRTKYWRDVSTNPLWLLKHGAPNGPVSQNKVSAPQAVAVVAPEEDRFKDVPFPDSEWVPVRWVR